jgi:hypothetical protein
MTSVLQGAFFPRASGNTAWRPLLDLHGEVPEKLIDKPFDLRRAEFHPAGDTRVTEMALQQWRDDLNVWAYDRRFPGQLDSERRSAWDVDLGVKLLDDTGKIPEALHPDVWCWLAVHLLPHFVVYRWGWPATTDGAPPTAREPWARFGSDLRNGLRLALHRIITYGADLAHRASEQEFQSIQYRPAFGLDQRVARVVLRTLVDENDDPSSNYGKNGGTRALDANFVCIELRLINSLQPLCFASDATIADTVRGVIESLPDLRRSDAPASGGSPSSASDPTALERG